jgi:hypothetical protein
MSIEEATLVDAGGGRPACRVRIDQPDAQRTMSEMQTIAAYYVLIANEQARESRMPRYQVVPVRPSLTGRVTAALTTLRSLVRSATSQPA